MRSKHREIMENILALNDHIEDLREENRKQHMENLAIMKDLRMARLILEDLKKRWEAMDDDKA